MDAMAFPTEITVSQLSRLIGLPDAPLVIDVRTGEDYLADPHLLPAAIRRDFATASAWGPEFAGRKIIVYCQKGLKLSQGTAAWLRHAGAEASSLEGGFLAWRQAGALLVDPRAIPAPDAMGRTVWVTRVRPKIDRIACPWLIRRFVDRNAVFLFVAPPEVEAVAERFGATAFDIEGAFWSHRDDRCTFDTMIAEFGLDAPALAKLATIVRAADTARLDACPEAAGFLAASLGLSRMFRDDLTQLDAAMLLYDAFYRWCRDAADETHNWPSSRPGA
jgi:rhodanese-related sulfurtransferase